MQDSSHLALVASASDGAKPIQRASSTAPSMPSPGLDQLMSDAARPSLPTSLSDFALPTLGSLSANNSMNALNALPSGSKDDFAPSPRRLRRSTLVTYLSESRLHASPLSMTFPPARSSRKGKERCLDGDDGEADETDSLRSFRDKDRMLTDTSSPSSESEVNTPPMRLGSSQLDELSDRPKSSPMDLSRSASPASALRPPADILEAGPSRSLARRPSCPLKPNRLLSLRAEARPEEIEVNHEAQFQKYLASHPDLPPIPGQSRSTRLPSDRGRYPEEAGQEDVFQREDTPSDDGEPSPEMPEAFYDYKIPSGTEPISFSKHATPAPSTVGTPEDLSFGITGSPGNVMDIDVPMTGSPSIPMTLWRQTPPPTAAPVRTNKRKHEDRYEPYAPAKRRAVSPSLAQLRDSGALISPLVIPRSPVLRSRGSFSQASSTVSSPTVSQSSSMMYGNGGPYSNGNGNYIHGHHRSGSSSSVVSSPTVRASMILASPILRPVPRLARRNGDEGDRIIDGAGEGLNGLNLG